MNACLNFLLLLHFTLILSQEIKTSNSNQAQTAIVGDSYLKQGTCLCNPETSECKCGLQLKVGLPPVNVYTDLM